jgi:hypothetical protein
MFLLGDRGLQLHFKEQGCGTDALKELLDSMVIVVFFFGPI